MTGMVGEEGKSAENLPPSSTLNCCVFVHSDEGVVVATGGVATGIGNSPIEEGGVAGMMYTDPAIMGGGLQGNDLSIVDSRLPLHYPVLVAGLISGVDLYSAVDSL